MIVPFASHPYKQMIDQNNACAKVCLHFGCMAGIHAALVTTVEKGVKFHTTMAHYDAI